MEGDHGALKSILSEVESRRREAMRPESRESDWVNVLRPAIGALNRKTLIDLCLEITKDANTPGVDKADLFERTKNRDLIDGLKQRHFNFKNIMGPFRMWQEKRFKELGKTGYDFEKHDRFTESNIDFFEPSYVPADYSSMELRAVESADEYMHKIAAQSITAHLNKGQTPAYAEATEMTQTAVDIRPIGLSEARAKTPSFQEEKETAQAINKSMKKHQWTAANQIMAQMQEYSERRLMTQMQTELFRMPSKDTIDFIRAEEKVLSQLEKRGFPTESIPEPELTPLEVVERTDVLMTPSDCSGAHAEFRERQFNEDMQHRKYRKTAEYKEQRIEKLQLELEEITMERKIGSPSDLTAWLQKPLGSF